MDPLQMMKNMMGMMQQADIDPNIMHWCMVLMRTPFFLDSPSAIRGQAKALGLSEEQVKNLLDIDNEARQKAKSVLTEDQRKKMGKVAAKPMAMMDLCQQISGNMTPFF